MGISTEMLVYKDMTSCTDLVCCHVVDEITTFCHCNLSKAIICGVASVRT